MFLLSVKPFLQIPYQCFRMQLFLLCRLVQHIPSHQIRDFSAAQASESDSVKTNTNLSILCFHQPEQMSLLE